MYHLDEIDRAGNRYTILAHDSFEHICAEAVAAKRARPSYEFVISNPEYVDIDCPDGLTDEEQELLP